MAGPNFDPSRQTPPPPGYVPPPGGWQQAAGLGPYGVPPPPPPEGWGVSKPTSGKAIAALVCSVGGAIVGGLGCWIVLPAVPVGFVLGLLGIAETGKNGKRSGRGLAIAGTIVGALAMAGSIAIVAFVINQARIGHEQSEQEFRAALEADVNLVAARLQEYHRVNGSLAPGGPYLAGQPAMSRNVVQGNGVDATGVQDGKVMVPLRIEHLVRESELGGHTTRGNMVLTVTGDNTARLEIKNDWQGSRVVEITSASTARWHFRE